MKETIVNKKIMLVTLACFGYSSHLQSMTSTASRSGQRFLQQVGKSSAKNSRKFSTSSNKEWWQVLGIIA